MYPLAFSFFFCFSFRDASFHFIFSLCCITKSSPGWQYPHVYVTPDVSISQNVNFCVFVLFVFLLFFLSPPSCCTYAPQFFFQWLCHELCNLLLCTSFTAIMSWIQNRHSCPLFCIKCDKTTNQFLYFPMLHKLTSADPHVGRASTHGQLNNSEEEEEEEQFIAMALQIFFQIAK